jgi:hypothetical protein
MTSPKEILMRALAAVEEAKTPTDLRESAFGRVFDLLANQPDSESTGMADSADKRPDETSSWEEKIAASFGISVADVGEAFEYADNELMVIVPTSAVSETTKDGVKELAHLVSAGRQAIGLEEATSTKIIRPIAQHYGKFDSHFAGNVDELENLFIVRQLNARDKSLKARRKAFEEAGQLVKRMLEDRSSH